MLYYIKELKKDNKLIRTAGIKARDDLSAIFEKEGMQPIDIVSLTNNREALSAAEKIKEHIKTARHWKDATGFLKKGDVLFIQFPVIEHTLFLYRIVKSIKRRKVKSVLFVHDLELFRHNKLDDAAVTKKIRRFLEETSILLQVDCIVVHNDAMKEILEKKKNIPGEKLISLDIFDYLIPDSVARQNSHIEKNGPIVISGNLSIEKARYIYSLPENVSFNLYGVNYKEQNKENIKYNGSFSSEEIPFVMAGSFGLVWDGESSKTCCGAFGDYLRINNPHKTSLYLASGLPVIIWDQAALAPFITKSNLGITVSSLYEIREKVANLTDEQYEAMKKNAEIMSKKLRTGEYTIEAIGKSINVVS